MARRFRATHAGIHSIFGMAHGFPASRDPSPLRGAPLNRGAVADKYSYPVSSWGCPVILSLPYHPGAALSSWGCPVILSLPKDLPPPPVSSWACRRIPNRARSSLPRGTGSIFSLFVKNHSFVDGNKRIAATLFLWFMQNNGILYRPDGSKRISDASLVALTRMIAESHTDEMDMMVKVVVSLINRKN